MTKRSVTKMGLMNIGRQIRGEAFDQDVFLTVTEAGILISPATGPVSDNKDICVARFDQYNRISLPSELRRAANINKKVDVTLDGNNLIIAPVIDVCAICGTDQNLHKVAQGKYICEACRKQMVRASRK